MALNLSATQEEIEKVAPSAPAPGGQNLLNLDLTVEDVENLSGRPIAEGRITPFSASFQKVQNKLKSSGALFSPEFLLDKARADEDFFSRVFSQTTNPGGTPSPIDVDALNKEFLTSKFAAPELPRNVQELSAVGGVRQPSSNDALFFPPEEPRRGVNVGLLAVLGATLVVTILIIRKRRRK